MEPLAVLAALSLAAVLKPAKPLRAIPAVGPLVAYFSQGPTAALISLSLLPLALGGGRLAFLHAAVILASLSPSRPEAEWTYVPAFIGAGATLIGNRYIALAAYTITIALKLAFVPPSGAVWMWSPQEVALAASWLGLWASIHASARAPLWPHLALIGTAAGSWLSLLYSAAWAVYESAVWRPAYSLRGVGAAGAFLLSLLAVGLSAWLKPLGISMEGNAFVDALGPLVGAAALGGTALFLAAVGRWLAAAVPAALLFSFALYLTGYRPYPDSAAMTNILMVALAASSAVAAASALRAGRPPLWRFIHAVAFASLALIAAGGPYIYNPSYTKFVIAEPGAAVWTLENWPYPSEVKLTAVELKVLNFSTLPCPVEAELTVQLDSMTARVAVNYGPNSPAIGAAYIPGYHIIAGPVWINQSSILSEISERCSTASVSAPNAWLVGFRPMPTTPWAALAVASLGAALALVNYVKMPRPPHGARKHAQ